MLFRENKNKEKIRRAVQTDAGAKRFLELVIAQLEGSRNDVTAGEREQYEVFLLALRQAVKKLGAGNKESRTGRSE